MVLLAALLLAGCGGDAGQGDGTGGSPPETTGPGPAMDRDPGELAGTRWVLLALGGRDPVEGTEITLRFQEGSLRGSGGCNSYSTEEVRTTGNTFEIGPVVSTQIGCKGPVGEQESAYLEALQTTGTYRLMGDRLEIKDSSGETVLLFEEA